MTDQRPTLCELVKRRVKMSKDGLNPKGSYKEQRPRRSQRHQKETEDTRDTEKVSQVKMAVMRAHSLPSLCSSRQLY